MKKFTTANFANFLKYHTPFSQICEKYGISEEELENAIRNVYHARRASEVINTLREFDEQVNKQVRKQKCNKPHEAIIEVAEITPDNVDEVVATIDEAMSADQPQPKSNLELLQEKEQSLSENLSKAERELEKLYRIQSEATQEIQNITKEIRQLRATIDERISGVEAIRDYTVGLKKQIAVAELDVEAIRKELAETQAAIKPVTITVLSDGWFKFEPSSIDIPKVEVSLEEKSATAALFALDKRFEKLNFINVRQFLQLDKMIKILEPEHPSITAKFEDENLDIAWAKWKGESTI